MEMSALHHKWLDGGAHLLLGPLFPLSMAISPSSSCAAFVFFLSLGLLCVDNIEAVLLQDCLGGMGAVGWAPELNLEGNSINQLVDQFTILLDEAGQRDDYTLVLSPNRHFLK
jgi:hypothetical protein